MAQYCRYCNHLVVGDAPYCSMHEFFVSESGAKRENKCKEFLFNPIDAFGENLNGYKPRAKKEPNTSDIKLWGD